MTRTYRQDSLKESPTLHASSPRIASVQTSSETNPSPSSRAMYGALDKPARRLTRFATWICAILMVTSLGARLVTWASGAMFAVFFSTMASGQAASLPAIAPASPGSAIVKASEAYRKAVLEGDAAGVAALYGNDAMEMPPFQRAITGRAAIEQFYRAMLKGPMRVTGFTFKHSETTADGDIGYDVGTYRRTMSGGPGGLVEAVGTFVVILKRSGGEWKIAYITYTCDCPPTGTSAKGGVH